MQDKENNELKEAVLGLNGTKKSIMTQKRVYFDEKSVKLIEMMLPIYKDEFAEDLNENEKISALLALAIKNLFNTDFQNKIKDLSK